MTQDVATSSDGMRIAYTVTGALDGLALLFVHGWSQSQSCWDETVSRLAPTHRCVTLDLRGHGASEKPSGRAAYTDTALWGEDVHAVLRATGIKRPILIGWSYGSRVLAAYLATHGAEAISGVCLVGGILAIGKARADWMVGTSSPGRERDLYTDDVPRRLRATAAFVEDCTTKPLPRQLYAEVVGANMLCPAHVRRALFEADLDFQDVYRDLTVPGLVIHGSADKVVTHQTGVVAADLIPNGRLLSYEGIGHAPFLEAPDRFAADLAAFAAQTSEVKAHA